jgi:hypothetical protein
MVNLPCLFQRRLCRLLTTIIKIYFQNTPVPHAYHHTKPPTPESTMLSPRLPYAIDLPKPLFFIMMLLTTTSKTAYRPLPCFVNCQHNLGEENRCGNHMHPRIFLLEMFLTALVLTLNVYTFKQVKMDNQKGVLRRMCVVLALSPLRKNEITTFFSLLLFPSWLPH